MRNSRKVRAFNKVFNRLKDELMKDVSADDFDQYDTHSLSA